MIPRAITLMVLAMAFFAVGDASIKLATGHASQGQVVVMLGGGGAAIFIAMLLASGGRLQLATIRNRVVALRCLFEILATIGMIVALSRIELSILAAILQTTPLIVTLGAALFLGEPVGWRRWSAVAVGLAGMLMVIRPLGASFTGWEIFAVLGASSLAARDLTSRRIPPDVTSLELSSWGFLSMIVPGLVLIALTRQPMTLALPVVVTMSVAILATAVGYLSLTVATRIAPAAVVSPFRYTRLVFTAGMGMVIFAERPDGWTYAGAALILAAGLYSFVRENRLARAGLAV